MTLLIFFIIFITMTLIVSSFFVFRKQYNEMKKWIEASDKKQEMLQNILVSFAEKQDNKQHSWDLVIEKRLAHQQNWLEQYKNLENKINFLSSIMSHHNYRGAFGETQLEHLLNTLFSQDLINYQFVLGNQKRVDAALWLPQMQKWLCIDAKFPIDQLENNPSKEDICIFKAKLKKHIRDIKEKYILGGETVENAILFLPAEGLFIWLNQHAHELISHAADLGVWITSPSTLPAILHLTLSLLREHKIAGISSNFIKDFQQLLDLINTQENNIQRFEKYLHQQTQNLHSVIQQHNKTKNFLYKFQENLETS